MSEYIILPACHLPSIYSNAAKLMKSCENALPPVVRENVPYAGPIRKSLGYILEDFVPLRDAFDRVVRNYLVSNREQIDKFVINITNHSQISERCLAILHMHSVECASYNRQVLDGIDSVFKDFISALPLGVQIWRMFANSYEQTRQHMLALGPILQDRLLTDLAFMVEEYAYEPEFRAVHYLVPGILSSVGLKLIFKINKHEGNKLDGNSDDSIENKIENMSLPNKLYAYRAYEFINRTEPEKVSFADQFVSEFHLQVLKEIGKVEESIPLIEMFSPMADQGDLYIMFSAYKVLKGTPQVLRAFEFQDRCQLMTLRILGVDKVSEALQIGQQCLTKGMQYLCFHDVEFDALKLLKNTDHPSRCFEFSNQVQIDILKIVGPEKVSLALDLGNQIIDMGWVRLYILSSKQHFIDGVARCEADYRCEALCLSPEVEDQCVNVLECISDFYFNGLESNTFCHAHA